MKAWFYDINFVDMFFFECYDDVDAQADRDYETGVEPPSKFFATLAACGSS